jgi:hypothetical protein
MAGVSLPRMPNLTVRLLLWAVSARLLNAEPEFPNEDDLQDGGSDDGDGEICGMVPVHDSSPFINIMAANTAGDGSVRC